jgi:hypothetical protein
MYKVIFYRQTTSVHGVALTSVIADFPDGGTAEAAIKAFDKDSDHNSWSVRLYSI